MVYVEVLAPGGSVDIRVSSELGPVVEEKVWLLSDDQSNVLCVLSCCYCCCNASVSF